jgi:hypothetical protein
MSVYPVPGTTNFTAYHTGVTGLGHWEDAYWVTGWHDENSAICAKRSVPGTHGGKAPSLHPGRVGGPHVSGGLTVKGVHTRAGFDLWLTAGRGEHTPTQMMADSRTWEVLVQPGTFGHVFVSGFVGWHRAYIGGGSLRNVNLTRLAQILGIPGGYWWNAIDAGGETASGWFTVTSFWLHVQGDHPVIRHHRHKHPVKHPRKPHRPVKTPRGHHRHPARQKKRLPVPLRPRKR